MTAGRVFGVVLLALALRATVGAVSDPFTAGLWLLFCLGAWLTWESAR